MGMRANKNAMPIRMVLVFLLIEVSDRNASPDKAGVPEIICLDNSRNAGFFE